jgi:Arc/MetJ-type ribon-helix-helix transcriptional regulator
MLRRASESRPSRILEDSQMYADLSPDNAAFLERQVATGAFPSGGDALNAAVMLLRRRAEVLEKVQRGVKQLENGEYEEFDEEGLDRFFEELFAISESQGRSE